MTLHLNRNLAIRRTIEIHLAGGQKITYVDPVGVLEESSRAEDENERSEESGEYLEFKPGPQATARNEERDQWPEGEDGVLDDLLLVFYYERLHLPRLDFV